MKIKKYNDGIAFTRDGTEIAFYSNITNRITFYPRHNKEWTDIGCSSVEFGELITIAALCKLEHSKNLEKNTLI